MLQKKRAEWRCEIRRRELDCMRENIRAKLLQPTNFELFLKAFPESMQGTHIEAILEAINHALKHQNKAQIDQHLQALIKILQQSPIQASVSLIILAKRVKEILNNLIKNRNQIEERSQWVKIDPSLQLHTIQLFLNAFSLMTFQQIREEEITLFVQSFWPLIENGSFDVYACNNRLILHNLLKTIKKMLFPRHKQIILLLKQFNLTFHLASIIEKGKRLSDAITIELIDILYLYFQQQGMHDAAEEACELGGITILGMQNSENEQFVRVCMLAITNRQQGCYFGALGVLIQLFGKHPHLISQVNSSFIKQLARLVKNEPDGVQKEAIKLICDIIAGELDLNDDLLANNYLLDALFIFLKDYRNKIDEDTRQFAYIVACIISNLTLSSNKGRVHMLLQHPIWQFALEQAMHSNSPFFPMITIFEYFFSANQSSPTAILDHYLFTVSQIDLKMIQKREASAIRHTIQRIYLNCSGQSGLVVKRMIIEHRLEYLCEQMGGMEQERELIAL